MKTKKFFIFFYQLLIKVKQFKFLKIIFRTKWKFKYPDKKKIIIFDGSENFIFHNYLERKDFDVLYTRKESINIPILIKSLFCKKYEKFFFNYYYTYIDYVKPKVIVTYIDNDIFFYRLKKYFKNLITIVIQNGHRGEDLFSALREYKKDKLSVDYIFAFSEIYKKLYLGSLNTNVIVHGSLKNNMFPIKKTEKPKSLLFISNLAFNYKYFNFGTRNYKLRKAYTFEEYHKSEAQLIPLIVKSCKKYSLDFGICGRADINNEYYVKYEYDYYKSLIGTDFKWEYFPTESMNEKFNLIDKFSSVIFIDSYLGYEAIARKKPVLAITIRDEIFKVISGRNFGFPEILQDKGPFWTNTFDPEYIKQIIHSVTCMSQSEWEQYCKKYIPKVAEYDFDNKKLFNLIKEKAELHTN
jgi:surface carbohydrate biosynthesis protein